VLFSPDSQCSCLDAGSECIWMTGCCSDERQRIMERMDLSPVPGTCPLCRQSVHKSRPVQLLLSVNSSGIMKPTKPISNRPSNPIDS